jgi:excinuclease UvrABC ATPase subunit
LDSRSATASDLADVLQFMRLLWALVHQLQRRSKRMSIELGVTGPHRLVLRVVGLFPGASAGTLAQILHVHTSTLTGVLQRLARQRLLRRTCVAAALRQLGPREAASTERAIALLIEKLGDSTRRRRAGRTARR